MKIPKFDKSIDDRLPKNKWALLKKTRYNNIWGKCMLEQDMKKNHIKKFN